MNKLGSCAALILCLSVGTSSAAEKTIDDYYVDFAVPDLTAFTLLGVNTEQVQRPGSMKELSAGILSAARGGSTITPGLAVEWNPVNPRSIDDYQRSKTKYLQFAFGTVQRDSAMELGVGARFNLLDRTDPLADKVYIESIRAAASQTDTLLVRSNQLRREYAKRVFVHVTDLVRAMERDGVPQSDRNDIAGKLTEEIWGLSNPPDSVLVEAVQERATRFYTEKGLMRFLAGGDAILEELSRDYVSTAHDVEETKKSSLARIVESRRKEFRQRHWNSAVVSLSFGWIGRSMDSTWNRFKGDRCSWVAGGSFPIGRNMQGIAQIDGSFAVRDSVEERSRLGVGGRVIAPFSDRRMSLEVYYANIDTRGDNMKTWRFTLGLETKLTQGSWFEIAFGGEFDPEKDTSSVIAAGSIKYGFRKEPRFQTP